MARALEDVRRQLGALKGDAQRLLQGVPEQGLWHPPPEGGHLAHLNVTGRRYAASCARRSPRRSERGCAAPGRFATGCWAALSSARSSRR
ncbi:hypothetical protein [Truepera radiovictrix]|uniref:Uncharacterized protein n=1 Tax=Truepera radiovictrix (strain DSM 17093 / CIP 108686 / LMG 22925 / RQ-24) TaxID=649638 RepID=D7CS10_TRURR|nr:hypothetical protein [Truepera radiovictrix]ADI15338.1 hypothetical protein Trad_2227 [Truepera radiovictrix DSM 17093]WMT56111.1 hypothetical protein RCV51_08810 [Truepera radiovictrix]